MGLFEILEYVSKVVYQVALLMCMDHIHNMFHVLLLYKYINDLNHVLRIVDIELKNSLMYEECLVHVLDRQVKELRNKQVPLIKVLWRNY